MNQPDPLDLSDGSKAIGVVLAVVVYMAVVSAIIAWRFIWNPGQVNHFEIGLALGTLFGCNLLASLWTALGPGHWTRFIPALGWSILIPLEFEWITRITSSHTPTFMIWLSGLGVFVFIQFVAWSIRYFTHSTIRRQQATTATTVTDTQTAGASVELPSQYGIKHLMIAMTLVAVIIGLGRALLPVLTMIRGMNEFPAFLFLAVATCLICFPLSFAVLAMRKPLLPTLLAIVFATIVTYIEIQAEKVFLRGSGPDWLHVTLINIFAVLPVLLLLVPLRRAEYRFLRSDRQI